MERVLVANRGEIALRVIEACHALGLQAVLAVSIADRDSLPARQADRTLCIGPASPAGSYLNGDALLTAALGSGCDALHPGYGFLSESAEFAERCGEHAINWVGPCAQAMRAAADKASARATAIAAGVPVLEASPIVEDVDVAVLQAERIGYPVLVKASAGGGGRGMSVAADERALRRGFAGAAEEARQAFGDGRVYVERYVRRARHVEVQLLGDRHGALVALGDRDCTVQRRHQKLLEEAPAVQIPDHARAAIREGALAFGRAIGLDSAATAEFLYDTERQTVAFLELNARIQVEHTVTEEVTGVDLVQAQLRIAAGEPLDPAPVTVRGHSLQCRITAESVERGFLPTPGTITRFRAPAGEGVRVDSACEDGCRITPFYDSLIAKVIVHADDRDAAIARMDAALADLEVDGVPTTAALHRSLLAHADFRAGRHDTGWLERERLAA
ncbi:MAG TPA: biotin carboxylase N-terminal domain-containing protein [Solirubrobacteraceae bacterium]|jgi:acetyl-CoA carboxylase biotin carboxylase subunit|nr:biotin carboxylase N-terminal domain-containing protein [Solirubrobacteraceae bacterium]